MPQLVQAPKSASRASEQGKTDIACDLEEPLIAALKQATTEREDVDQELVYLQSRVEFAREQLLLMQESMHGVLRDKEAELSAQQSSQSVAVDLLLGDDGVTIALEKQIAIREEQQSALRQQCKDLSSLIKHRRQQCAEEAHDARVAQLELWLGAIAGSVSPAGAKTSPSSQAHQKLGWKGAPFNPSCRQSPRWSNSPKTISGTLACESAGKQSDGASKERVEKFRLERQETPGRRTSPCKGSRDSDTQFSSLKVQSNPSDCNGVGAGTAGTCCNSDGETGGVVIACGSGGGNGVGGASVFTRKAANSISDGTGRGASAGADVSCGAGANGGNYHAAVCKLDDSSLIEHQSQLNGHAAVRQKFQHRADLRSPPLEQDKNCLLQ